jgi:hypothetical protein
LFFNLATNLLFCDSQGQVKPRLGRLAQECPAIVLSAESSNQDLSQGHHQGNTSFEAFSFCMNQEQAKNLILFILKNQFSSGLIAQGLDP